MGGCLSAPPQAQHYSSKHSSANGGGRSSPYAGYSAYTKPPPPDFGISSCYEVHRLLGEGGTGQTWLCKELATGDLYAIKLIKRPIPRVVMPMLRHEIQIQARLGEGHVNLVKAREVLLSHGYLGIVMQYAAGGTMTQYVSDRWSTTNTRHGLFLSEDEARFVFHQVLSAMEFLHHHHVAHRDLKLDNIVLTDDFPPRIKLCDFGFAKDWHTTSNMRTVIGTPVYMAPEVIDSKRHSLGYDAPKAELWACGVLLFVMLLGMFPFDHIETLDANSSQAQVEVWMQQKRGSWRDGDRMGTTAQRLSPECMDLLEKIFVVEESRRISVADVRLHPWMCQPMSVRFQHAWDGVRAEQLLLQERTEPCKVPQVIPGLDALLEAACRVGVRGDAVQRLDLVHHRPGLHSGLSHVEEASERASSCSTWTVGNPSSPCLQTLYADASVSSLPPVFSLDSAASVRASARVEPDSAAAAAAARSSPTVASAAAPYTSCTSCSTSTRLGVAGAAKGPDQGFQAPRYRAAPSASSTLSCSHSAIDPPSQRGTPTQISSLYTCLSAEP